MLHTELVLDLYEIQDTINDIYLNNRCLNDFMKSQSAMEYLMTYGWAILIIAVVLAAFYYLGIFNTSSKLNTCIGVSGYECTNPVLYSNGALSLNLNEISSSYINVVDVGCSNSTKEPQMYPQKATLGGNQPANLVFYCPLNNQAIGTGFTGTLWIEYTVLGSTEVQTQDVGEVSATVISGVQTNNGLAIDGHNTFENSDTENSIISLSTTQANDLIVVYVGFDPSYQESPIATGVSSVTDTAGLTWQMRSEVTSNDYCSVAYNSIVVSDYQEVWYAISPNPLSNDNIQVNYNGWADDQNLIAFGISGVNVSSPWNSGSVPATAEDTSGTSEYTNAIVTVATAGSLSPKQQTMLLAFVGNDAYCQQNALAEYSCTFGPWTGTSDYNSLGTLPNCGGSWSYDSGAEYKVVTTAQDTQIEMYDPTGRSEYWSMIGDAVNGK